MKLAFLTKTRDILAPSAIDQARLHKATNSSQFAREYKDYSKRLISLSWGILDVEEARERMARDINNDFLCVRRPGEFWEYTNDPKVPPLEKLIGEERDQSLKFFTVIQIDFLRPTHDYIDLRSNGMDYAMVTADEQLEGAMKTLGINADWWIMCCTTSDDHKASAYRRSIIVLNRDVNDKDAAAKEILRHIIDPDVMETLENILEDAIREEI